MFRHHHTVQLHCDYILSLFLYLCTITMLYTIPLVSYTLVTKTKCNYNPKHHRRPTINMRSFWNTIFSFPDRNWYDFGCSTRHKSRYASQVTGTLRADWSDMSMAREDSWLSILVSKVHNMRFESRTITIVWARPRSILHVAASRLHNSDLQIRLIYGHSCLRSLLCIFYVWFVKHVLSCNNN